ncbi:MAG: 2OG-Fe(II) oxygenase family protein [Brevundimonas sp.]|uniref:2OG-Fe(II) oxygenase n=2 Tax=Brevundimonas sp. TaxID=1871086 RepID=UPI002727721A|nr:2OG-Fe(II) oxygenase family protein [Brevundimonas sp.]MDO9588321.1 2OG-Fe(II) oxygenase family protein [Brevundimonas sp.]MDP3657010.1 2OG-Fe(II) oxygenase family protein [Brevundimonas sp.]MDZ4319204.1 2OG-Fe(II) oxygenase family protein [Phenylobacterium sp.]
MSRIPTLALSPDLEVATLGRAFAARRRLHIPGVLASDSAEAVVAAMEAFDDWKASIAAGGEFFELPLKGRAAVEAGKQSWIDQARVDGANPGMQYIFDTRRLGLEAEMNAPDDAVGAVLEFLNTPAFLGLVRAVTGDDRIDFADAQATRYRPGHVLTGHDDWAAGKNRLYAYVLNLTREWRVDWGGALIFPDANGHIEEGFAPAFNALNLFAVPMRHAVTQVASFAPRDRLSITGWLRSYQAVGPQT